MVIPLNITSKRGVTVSTELDKLKEEETKLQKEIELKEAKKRIADLKAKAGSIEVVETEDPSKLNEDLRDAKAHGQNQEKILEGINKLVALQERQNEKDIPVFKGKFISKEVVKQYGAKGIELAAKTEDFVREAVNYEIAGMLTRMHPANLRRFQKRFGGGRELFNDMYKMAIAQKVLNTSDDADWVNIDFNNVAAMHVQNVKQVFKAISVIKMGSNPFNWPISAGPSTDSDHKSTEGTAVTAGDGTPGKVQWDAQTIQAVREVTEEMEEDAAFAIVPFVQQLLLDDVGDFAERLICFGDKTTATPSTNINDIDTANATSTRFDVIDGMAHVCLIESGGLNVSVSGGADEIAATVIALQTYGNAGVDPERNSFICPPSHYYKILEDVVDLSKFGAAGSGDRGTVLRLLGMPVYITSGIPKTNTAGKVDGVTAGNNTQTSFLIARRDMNIIDLYRGPKMAEDFDPIAGKREIAVSMRLDYRPLDETALVYGYNRS